MLGLQLRMETRVAIIQSLQLSGGATESIFPQVEALLLANTDYQKALECVAARKQMERYRSVIDFLFCELHPQWRRACFRFYLGGGQQLKDILRPEQLVEYSDRMLKSLEIACDLFREDRCKSWKQFSCEVAAILDVA